MRCSIWNHHYLRSLPPTPLGSRDPFRPCCTPLRHARIIWRDTLNHTIWFQRPSAEASTAHPQTPRSKNHSLEADSRSADQEIPRLLRSPDDHHPVHKSPPLVPILSQINPVHTIPSHFSKISLNFVLPPASEFSQWSLSLRLSQQILYALLFSPIRATCPAHLILLDLAKSTSYEAPQHADSKWLLGPNWVGASPSSPEGGNRSRFRNVVFSRFQNTGRSWSCGFLHQDADGCCPDLQVPLHPFQHFPSIYAQVSKAAFLTSDMRAVRPAYLTLLD
jgi:hypothetical protein